MTYELTLTEEAAEDLDKIADDYSSRFSTGAGDFLDAIIDTLDRIKLSPTGYQIRFEDNKGRPRRGIKVKANRGSKNYAKQFPYLVLYYLDLNSHQIIITEIFPMAFPEEKMRGHT